MTLPFDVLDPQQKIYGNYFLEASAGTGKTFTIAHLVVRLLCESSPAIDISKIGVVTFTKAAASELKTRIKDLITEVKEAFEKGSPTFIDETHIDKKEIIYRLNLALIDFNFAPISTIHGFSFQILKKYALHLKLKPQIQSQDETSIDALCYDHIKDILKSEELTACLCKKQKEYLLSSKRGDLHALIMSLKQLVLSGIAIEDLPSWEDFKVQILHSIKAEIPSKEDLLSFINRHKLSPITKDEALNQLDILHSVYTLKSNIEELLIKKPFWDYLKIEKLKLKLDENYSKEAEKFFQNFRENTALLIKKALLSSLCELKLASVCKISFEKLLQEKGILSFSSMLQTLDQGLKPSIASIIQKDYEAMIVDEFQDTDPVQWSILKKLFVDHPVKAFYMVGDPKQAIYAFRSADVYTYIQAKKECPNLHVGTLQTCFRSSASFIDALNAFLSKVTWLRLPFLNEAYPYHPVKSSKKDDPSVKQAFTFYDPKESLDDAEILSKDIALMLNKLHPEDTVAILVKDRFQLERIEGHLKLAGGLYQSVKSESLDGSRVFTLLDELLLLLNEPISKSSLNRFMVSDWLNYDLLDFEKSKQALIFPEAVHLCENLKMFFTEHGFLATVEKLLDLTWPQEQTAFRLLLASLYGAEVIDQLFDVGLAITSRVNTTKGSSLLRLELHLLKKENFKLTSINQSSSRIYLLTSHMSKGLEYDHVITVGIATRYEKPPEIILKRINVTACLGPYFCDHVSTDALYDLDMEKLRQMYVAITRAKKSVHIPQISYEMDDLDYSILSPLEFYILLIKHPEYSYKELYASAALLNLEVDTKNIFSSEHFCHENNVEVAQNTQGTITISVLDKSLPLCKIEQDNTVSFSSLKTESEFEKTDDPLKGRDFGDFFHMLIEDLLTSGRYQLFDEKTNQDYYSLLIDISPFHEHKDQILSYLKNCIELKLPFDDQTAFCLKDIPLKDIYVEKAFSYHTEIGTMKGFIDCTFVFNNHLFFIDWKTSFLKNTHQEALVEHMKKASYDLQLDIYKSALMLQKNYFKDIPLKKAFYVFVKQAVFYQKIFEELPCSI